VTDVQSWVAATYDRLADVLAAAAVEVWDAPSLCEKWLVRHVIAHVTMPARLTPEQFGAEMAAAGGDFTVLSDTVARRDASLVPGIPHRRLRRRRLRAGLARQPQPRARGDRATGRAHGGGAGIDQVHGSCRRRSRRTVADEHRAAGDQWDAARRPNPDCHRRYMDRGRRLLRAIAVCGHDRGEDEQRDRDVPLHSGILKTQPGWMTSGLEITSLLAS